MRTVNMHEAKTHLSRLVEGAVNGESFIIARAGKPLVKVTSIEEPEQKPKIRFGVLKGQFKIPHDFDTMMQKEIQEMFYGPEE